MGERPEIGCQPRGRRLVEPPFPAQLFDHAQHHAPIETM